MMHSAIILFPLVGLQTARGKVLLVTCDCASHRLISSPSPAASLFDCFQRDLRLTRKCFPNFPPCGSSSQRASGREWVSVLHAVPRLLFLGIVSCWTLPPPTPADPGCQYSRLVWISPLPPPPDLRPSQCHLTIDKLLNCT